MFKIILFLIIIYECTTNTVFMTLVTTESEVGAISDYSISIDRTRDVQGNDITPTSVSNPIKIRIALAESYTIE